jgi:hypothetical protein
MDANLITRLHLALPELRKWVDKLLVDHAAEAQKIDAFGFSRLVTCYPAQLLNRARVISTPDLPYPPVVQLGLQEFKPSQHGERLGITFLETFFFLEGRASDSLFFLELVHVVQWSHLGFDRFRLAYAHGLSNSRPVDSPLEKMAYSLQEDFERGSPFADLIGHIDRESDAIWRRAAAVVGAPRNVPQNVAP